MSVPVVPIAMLGDVILEVCAEPENCVYVFLHREIVLKIGDEPLLDGINTTVFKKSNAL
ncbi:MAG: hypothetical protein WBQ59_11310 [Candidatus Acidiferrum sp.]